METGTREDGREYDTAWRIRRRSIRLAENDETLRLRNDLKQRVEKGPLKLDLCRRLGIEYGGVTRSSVRGVLIDGGRSTRCSRGGKQEGESVRPGLPESFEEGDGAAL